MLKINTILLIHLNNQMRLQITDHPPVQFTHKRQDFLQELLSQHFKKD